MPHARFTAPRAMAVTKKCNVIIRVFQSDWRCFVQGFQRVGAVVRVQQSLPFVGGQASHAAVWKRVTINSLSPFGIMIERQANLALGYDHAGF